MKKYIYALIILIILTPRGRADFTCGDANGDSLLNILDITYLIAFLYMGGPAPVLEIAADVNSNGEINILDVTHLISFLYNEGPELVCTTATEPAGYITGTSKCLDHSDEKGVTAVDDTLDCVEYSYDGETILNLYHRNAGLNCCPVIVANIAIEDNMIIVEELDSLDMGGCPCLCLFNIDYQIYNLPPGMYTIKFIEPYVWAEEEQLEFIVDLSSPTEGSHCVYRNEYPWGQW